ncbi:hypothetical protein E1B28_008469 [Marasmius oreades]|uniref:Uncharacterized protein n=1 Tax=Marasmius oreades TaxID=181124 RepID=A0A9P7RZ21_9AGAR|nr:uncharacterized protein E1B28_008469 [Marasmius oreades]KAG7092093.1 hypothetical protein E1B28_008469 [Marasmius oreades]
MPIDYQVIFNEVTSEEAEFFLADGRVFSHALPTSIPTPPIPNTTDKLLPELVDSIFNARRMTWFDPDRPYLPLIPRFDIILLRSHPAFYCLSHKNGVFPVIQIAGGQWKLDPSTAEKWDTLEKWLKVMAKQLARIGDPGTPLISSSFSMWPYPARYGYLSFVGAKADVQRMAALARDAFFLLIATCTFFILCCRDRAAKDPYFDWTSQLHAENSQQSRVVKIHASWIHDLLASFAGDPTVERIGSIFEPKDHRTLPFLRLFREVKMPMLLHWGNLCSGQHPLSVQQPPLPSGSLIDTLKDFAPSASAINRLILKQQEVRKTNHTQIFSPRTVEFEQIESIPLPKNSKQKPGENVHDFLKRREAEQERRALNESADHRRVRLQREVDAKKTPPGKRAVVCHWEKYQYNFRVRTPLTRREVDDAWDRYGKAQKIYNSWDHCWDICTEFGEDDPEPFDEDDMDVDIDRNLGETFLPVLEDGGDLQLGGQARDLEEGEIEEGELREDGPTTSPNPLADQVSWKLLMSNEDIEGIDVDFDYTMEDMAYARYGFVDLPFDLGDKGTPWNITSEALGNGRWLNNPLNARFNERDPESDTKLRLQSLFHKLESCNINGPIPRIPVLDTILIDSPLRTRSFWRFSLAHRKIGEEDFFQLGGKDEFHLLLSDPIAVLHIQRMNWGPTLVDVACKLVQHGIRFHTLLCGPQGPQRSHARKSERSGEPRLGYRPQTYAPDVNDFLAYESSRNEFLRSPRGRIALLEGGIVARIAREVVDEETVVYGPDKFTVYTTGECFFEEDGVGYWGDVLTEEEIDLICGVYFCATKNQKDWGDPKYLSSHRSWFPRPGSFNHGSLNIGVWSKDCEKWYQHRLKECRSGTKVMSGSSWRSAMQFNHKVPKIIKISRKIAYDFLQARC